MPAAAGTAAPSIRSTCCGIVEDLYRSGTAVAMVAEELPVLPAGHRAALIRVGREMLRNAAQHAPGTNVVLSLHTYAGHVMLAASIPARYPARRTATSA